MLRFIMTWSRERESGIHLLKVSFSTRRVKLLL